MTKKIKKKVKKLELSKKFTSVPNVFILIMVTLLAVSVLAEIFIPTYKTNPALYGLMGGVVGLLIKSAK